MKHPPYTFWVLLGLAVFSLVLYLPQIVRELSVENARYQALEARVRKLEAAR